MTRYERTHGVESVLRQTLGMAEQRLARKFYDVAEVRRWIASLQDDPWFKVNPVPFMSAAFCAIIGMDKRDVQTIVRGDGRRRMTATKYQRFGKVMEDIESGRLLFLPKITGYGRNAPARAVWLEPPESIPLPQSRIVARCDYLYWSRCRSCGGRRYLGIDVASSRQAACYDCLPPSRYANIGARLSTRRLALDMLAAGGVA